MSRGGRDTYSHSGHHPDDHDDWGGRGEMSRMGGHDDRSRRSGRRGGSPPRSAGYKRSHWRSPSRERDHREDRHKSFSRRSHRGRPSVSRSSSETRKRRRQWRFDSPPKAANAGGDAAGQGGAAGGSKSSNFSTGPAGSSVTPGLMDSWILGSGGTDTLTAAELAQLARTMNLTAEGAKAARELYIGNLPPGVDVNQLIEFLNAALLALKLNVMPGSPVVKSWISTDGHFAFVEFRTMEEASAGMQLNGLNCLGYNLRIGRPKTYPAELAVITQKLEDAARLRMASSMPGCVDGSNGVAAGEGLTSGSAAASAALLAAAAAGGVPNAAMAEPPKLPASPVEAAIAAQKAAAALGLANSAAAGGLAGGGFPCTERLVLLNIPYTLNETRTRELLSAFGALKSFVYITNPKCEESETPADASRLIGAYEDEDMPTAPPGAEAVTMDIDAQAALCCFEYEEIAHGRAAKTAIDNVEVCGKTLTLVDAADGVSRGILTKYLTNNETAAAIAGDIIRTQVPTRVVMLGNLTNADELVDDKEYGEIVEDVRTECSEIGEVLAIEIPRPSRGFAEGEIDQSAVGFAFVKMKTVEGASKVRKTLGGRRFAGLVVEANYFSEVRFARRDFAQPQPNYSKEESSVYNPALLDVLED